MNLRQYSTEDIKDKIVLYRSPYDIGVNKTEGGYQLKDTARIEVTLPTLRHLLENNCRIVILTYVGRPDGKVVETLTTTPHARALSKLLNMPVKKVDDCVGDTVTRTIHCLKEKEILMLENTRFHKEENADDEEFAKQLARNGEVIIFDAFPQAHRKHASTTGIMKHLPSFAGDYLVEEVRALEKLDSPQKPFVVIIGGAKISDKIDALNTFSKKADYILVGGAIANVFFKALGFNMGDSFVEDTFVDKNNKEERDLVTYAKEILGTTKAKIVLPKDFVIKDENNNHHTVDFHVGKNLVPDGFMTADIGPKTREEFASLIEIASTVFFNGPLGLTSSDDYKKGTLYILNKIALSSAFSVVAGGDTTPLLKEIKHVANIDHISLAGGATLEFLGGKKLPVLEMLKQE